MPTSRLTRLGRSFTAGDQSLAHRLQGISSLHFLKVVEDQGGIGFWSIDYLTGAGTCSIGCYRLLDIAPEVALDQSFILDLIHPDDRAIKEEFDEILRQGGAMSVEFRIIRPNGSIRWLKDCAEVICDDRGKPLRAIGILREATELHEASQIIIRLRERHRLVLKAAGAAEWTLDASGTLISKHSWTELTGQGSGEATGWGWLEMVMPEDRIEVRTCWMDALTHHTILDCKVRVKKISGGYQPVHIKAVPFIERDGTIAEWVGGIFPVGPAKTSEGSHVPRMETRITGVHIRTARALLHWSHADLAEASGLSVSSVRRAETDVEAPRSKTMATLRAAFAAEGIEFCIEEGYSVSIKRRLPLADLSIAEKP